jgi:hypothetical protein
MRCGVLIAGNAILANAAFISPINGSNRQTI